MASLNTPSRGHQGPGCEVAPVCAATPVLGHCPGPEPDGVENPFKTPSKAPLNSRATAAWQPRRENRGSDPGFGPGRLPCPRVGDPSQAGEGHGLAQGLGQLALRDVRQGHHQLRLQVLEARGLGC